MTRSQLLTVRVSPEEYAAIKTEAAAFGLSVSELVRSLPSLGEAFRAESYRVGECPGCSDPSGGCRCSDPGCPCPGVKRGGPP